MIYLYGLKNNTGLVTLTIIIMMVFYNNFITFRESVNYALEFKTTVSSELIGVRNSLENDNILVLKSPSFVATLYNMIDYFGVDNIKITLVESKKTNYNKMFMGQVSWEIDSKKSKVTKASQKNVNKAKKQT